MKKVRKAVLDAILFIAIIALTFYWVLHGEDLSAMTEAIKECDWVWLIPAAGCVCMFIAGESLVIWHMLCSYGIAVKKRVCFLFSSVGFFFSCVTPSASGGQPMQIYFMRKEKIPVPISTVVLMIVTITYKLVLVVIGLGLMIFANGFLRKYAEDVMGIFYLGVGLNVFCVISMTILVFDPHLARKLVTAIYTLLARFRIMKKTNEKLESLEKSMKLYQETAKYMKNHIGLICRVFLITVIQRFFMFAVTCFVYRAFSLHGTGWIEIIFLQAVISISVDMLPLPGGMGISEGLFMVIFKPVFGEALLLPGLLLSRGMGYYSELLLSAVFTGAAVVVFRLREGKKR